MNCKHLLIARNQNRSFRDLWQHCCRRNKSESSRTMHCALSSAQTHRL